MLLARLRTLAPSLCSGGVAATGLPSLPSVLRRAFADDATPSGEQPAAEAAAGEVAAGDAASPDAGGDAAALAAAAASEEEEDVLPAGPTAAELEGYSRRQRAYLGADPEKYKHFKPRLSRRERGSFADASVAAEFEEESERYPSLPEDVPLYDLRTAVPEIYQPDTQALDRLKAVVDAHPGLTPEELLQRMGLAVAEEAPPAPGAAPILRWEVQLVMAVGTTKDHPANKKATCRVFLRELQQQAGLSDAALQHVARVAGPRYNPGKGELTLTSEAHPHREDNRAHIVRMLRDLVEEGRRLDARGGRSAQSA